MMAPLGDHEIDVEALRRGDRAEFARMVDAYSASIYRLNLRMLGNEQDAEDALQNTFISALTHFGSFEGRSSLLTWLYRIAVNEALMILRRGKPEVSMEDQDSADDGEFVHPAQFVDWAALPEDELVSGEGRHVLDEAIQGLPENLRAVFLLRDIQELSIRETADALGITEANVKVRLLRARLLLRESLSYYYGAHMKKEKENG